MERIVRRPATHPAVDKRRPDDYHHDYRKIKEQQQIPVRGLVENHKAVGSWELLVTKWLPPTAVVWMFPPGSPPDTENMSMPGGSLTVRLEEVGKKGSVFNGHGGRRHRGDAPVKDAEVCPCTPTGSVASC